MTQAGNRDLARRYYRAWASRDREACREALADDLGFRSSQDRIRGADAFLEACWKYSEGLAEVRFVCEIFEGERGFVLMEWIKQDGGRFAGAEVVRFAGGKLSEILVLSYGAKIHELIRHRGEEGT